MTRCVICLTLSCEFISTKNDRWLARLDGIARANRVALASSCGLV